MDTASTQDIEKRNQEVRKAFVYLIICKENNAFYIGKSVDPFHRFWAHMDFGEAGKGTTPLYRSVRKYGASAFELAILEENDSEVEAYDAERWWTKKFRRDGKKVFNLNDGGEGNFSPCPETLARMSRAQKGKTVSPETREKIAAKLRGTKLSQETLEKISAALKGRKLSPEALEKAKINAKKRSQDPEWRRKNREAVTKTAKDPEIRKKMAAALRSFSDEDAKEAYTLYSQGSKIKDLKVKYNTTNTTLYNMLRFGAELLGVNFVMHCKSTSDARRGVKNPNAFRT